MAVMFTACGAQLTGRVTAWNLGKLRTLEGICKVWEKFFVKQLLFLLPPKFADSSLLMDLANSSGDCFRTW